MFRKLVLAGCVLAGLGAFTAAEAQQRANEVRLGGKDVDLTKGQDRIDLSTAKGSYVGVRLIARKGIEISKVRVVYAGAPAYDEIRNINLRAGERTRPINLGTSERFVDAVEITYKQTSNKDEARVEVFGMQTSAGARNTRTAGVVAAAKPAAQTTPTPTVPAVVKPGAPIKGKIEYAGNGEVLFAENTVGLSVDRDTVKIGADIGKFDRIRLRVLENDLDLVSLKVVYSDGEPDTLTVNRRISKGTTSSGFPLKGDRFIKELQLVYKALPKPATGTRNAIVQVLGEYSEGWLQESRKFNEGWYLLGSESAGVLGFKRDLLTVGRNSGGFTKLRFTVKNRDITLKEVKVNFRNKNSEVVPVDSKIAAGTTFGPVGLKGGFGIDTVQLVYRGRIFSREQGRAIVEVWGHE